MNMTKVNTADLQVLWIPFEKFEEELMVGDLSPAMSRANSLPTSSSATSAKALQGN